MNTNVNLFLFDDDSMPIQFYLEHHFTILLSDSICNANGMSMQTYIF